MAQRLGFMNDLVQFGEVCKALIHLSMGDLDQAEKYLESSNVKQNPLIMHVVAFNLALGKVRLDQGRDDEAKTCLETCVDAFKKSEFSPIPPHQVEVLVHLTTTYAKRGQLDEAQRCLCGLSSLLRLCINRYLENQIHPWSSLAYI